MTNNCAKRNNTYRFLSNNMNVSPKFILTNSRNSKPTYATRPNAPQLLRKKLKSKCPLWKVRSRSWPIGWKTWLWTRWEAIWLITRKIVKRIALSPFKWKSSIELITKLNNYKKKSVKKRGIIIKTVIKRGIINLMTKRKRSDYKSKQNTKLRRSINFWW